MDQTRPALHTLPSVPPPAPLALRGVDCTAIHTRQMEAMRAFYGSTLGLALQREPSPRWVEFRAGTGTLALTAPGGRFGDAALPVGAASLQIAFRVAPDEVARCAALLAQRGVPILSGPTDEAFGHRTLFFRDPDGNVLEIYAELPQAKAAGDAAAPAGVAQQVSLREITADTVRRIVALKVSEYQNRFVAPNALSLAQALFAPEAWYRAIYLGDEPVGFVMLSDDSLRDPLPAKPQVGVWRLMVDARYQHRGIGRAAMQLVIAHVRAKRLFDKLSISYVPADGGPEALYRSLGFEPTGEVDDGEVVLALALEPSGG